jgi:hypothetical protein
VEYAITSIFEVISKVCLLTIVLVYGVLQVPLCMVDHLLLFLPVGHTGCACVGQPPCSLQGTSSHTRYCAVATVNSCVLYAALLEFQHCVERSACHSAHADSGIK